MQRHDAPDSSHAATETDPEPRFGDDGDVAPDAGLDRLIRVDVVLTAVFVVSAVFAAVVFDDAARVVGVVAALALFAVGTFAFLMGYFVAVGRSRTEELAVAELYLLAGKALPGPAKRTLLWALGVQVVTALATALARSSTDGKAGSTLAFGVLVPMLGLGINGLASARYGAFGPRRRRADIATSDDLAADERGPRTPDEDEPDDEEPVDDARALVDADAAVDTTEATTERDDVPPQNHDLD